MARWLRVEPRVLVLDEPTQGVDVGSKADIHRLVDQAAAGGAAVVVCSTDTDELARLATRVLVLRRGRVGAELTGADIETSQIEQEQLLPAHADGGVQPSTTRPTSSRRTVMTTPTISTERHRPAIPTCPVCRR